MRFNVFLRDHFTCQYCGDPGPAQGRTPPQGSTYVPRRDTGKSTSWVLQEIGRCFPPNFFAIVGATFYTGIRN